MTPEFNKWWDGDDMTAENPYTKDTPAYWAWEGWVAGSRSKCKWNDITDEELNAMSMAYESWGSYGRAVANALKRRNT